MKKQIIILLLTLTTTSYLYAQEPCNDNVIMNTKGKWIKSKVRPDKTNFTKTQELAIASRMEEMYKMMLKVIPVPMGLDGDWRYRNYDERFASKVKYFTTKDGRVEMEFVKLNHLSGYDCIWHFCDLGCYDGKIVGGYPCDGTAAIMVTVNNFGAFLTGGELPDNDVLIDGEIIKRKETVQGSWKGYDLMWEGRQARGYRRVLIHRKGELPYTPVTRKQYLDRALIYVNKFYDDMIKSSDQVPMRSLEEQEALKNKTLDDYKKKYGSDPKILKSTVDYFLMSYQTDQQRRDDQVKIIVKNKNADLKNIRDELEKTTKEGLLDSPAIVTGGNSGVFNPGAPVFSTEEGGGSMLVTENLKYIRKDLPADVPQFIVLYWQWSDSKPGKNLRKQFEENFEVEKLQAMIDK
ncbi:MAG: hypothetical protein ABIW38_02290 [Ferruginibacter sp.]